VNLAENFIVQRFVAATLSGARYSFALHFPGLSVLCGMSKALSSYFTGNNN
tara:strand:- start:719 stop:871 length:153 start_codon:yes stop_codon:yes gene_type:complete